MPRPAPVTTATRPSKERVSTCRRCPVPGGSGGRGGPEAEQFAQGAADDGGPLGCRHTGELRGEELPAAAEGPLGVWVVVAPHDGREPADMARRHGDGVVLERH